MRRASAALTEAKTIQQTKKILDVAAAAEIYARRQKLGVEAEDLATAIKVEALRKLGEMLQKAPKATAHVVGSIRVPTRNDAPTLSDLGLTKKESAVAQKLAALPEKVFEQVRDGHVTITKAIAAVDAAKAAKQKPKKPNKPVVDPLQHVDDRDEVGDAMASLVERNQHLEERLAVEAMDASEEERTAAAHLIASLRSEIAVLRAENKALKDTRNSLMTEAAQLKQQCKFWRRKAEKVAA